MKISRFQLNLLSFFLKRIRIADGVTRHLEEIKTHQPIVIFIRKKSYISLLLFQYYALQHFENDIIFAASYDTIDKLESILKKNGCVLVDCESDQFSQIVQILNQYKAAVFAGLILWNKTDRYKTNTYLHYPEGILKLFLFLFRSKRAQVIMSREFVLPKPEKCLEFVITIIENERVAILGKPQLGRKQLIEEILNDPDYIRKLEEISPGKNNKIKAKRYLYEIATNKKYSYLNKVTKLLNWMTKRLLEGIETDQEGLEKVKELSKTKQLIYLPSHRSHADYLFLGSYFHNQNLDTPVTAAGINLAFFPLGFVFRRLGAYFLRRTFKGNPFYAITFATYLEKLLQQGSNQMFFIEGGRSRSGKLLQAKLGMLSMIMQVLRQNKIADLVFVPMSVDYGKLFEGESYIQELSGKEKQKENILGAMETLKYFKRKQGRIYTQFAEPFSVRDYLQERQIDLQKLDDKQFNHVVQKLGSYIIHEINSVVTVTPSAIVSLVLLSNPKPSISHEDLMRVCKMVYSYLSNKHIRKPDFTDLDSEIVEVIKTFEASNFVKSVETNLARVYKVVEVNRLYLDYYKNNIIHLFLQISFISSILNAHESDSLSIAELNREIDFLKDLFWQEFIFADQFWNEKTYNEALRYLSVVREIKLLDDQIELSKRHHVWIDINRFTITNFFEAYYSFFDYVLNHLTNNDKKSEKDLLRDVIKYAWDLFEISILLKPESISKDIYRNVLKYSLDNQFLILEKNQLQLNMKKLETAKAIRKKLYEYIHS